MAERLLEAWELARQVNPDTPYITPEGEPSAGGVKESLIPEDPTERRLYAMRLIAQRCIYGVDKNPLAVEMAKLSLWLLTMAKDKPFEFLDHSIRSGDSLVGLHSIDQLRHFSLKPDADDAVLFRGPLDEAVDEAIELRLRLEDLPANTVEDVERQEQLLLEANEKIARLRCAADLLVAAEYWGENAKDKMERVRQAAVKSGYYVEKGPTEEFERVAREAWTGNREPSSRSTDHEPRSTLSPFHWPLEFPEVLVKRGGFDAFVGNPPFMGGTKLEPAFGAPWRQYLVTQIAKGRRGIRGTADLSAYFFLQAHQLLRAAGCFGLLATNTIAQGDSRDVGLFQILEGSASIYRARKTLRWPGTASLEVSCIWLTNSIWQGHRLLDDRPVAGISSFLADATSSDQAIPLPLAANADLVIEGVKVVGDGFILTTEEAQSLIGRTPKNVEVVRPFLMGRDINSRPDHSPSRFVINFQMWPLRSDSPDTQSADKYPQCLALLEEKVKPERMQYPPDSSWNRGLRDRWWQFGLPRPALMNGIRTFERVLARSRVSNIHALVFVPTDVVFSDATNVFFFDDWHSFGVLQSCFHIVWLEEYASTMKTDIRYTPASCFDTFVRPDITSETLKYAEKYYSHRDLCLAGRGIGLTVMYGLAFDPKENTTDIQKLRDLHVEMDNAVAAAYGWTDLELGHGFHETKQGIRFTISEPARREVLQRLLKLNHERYAEEVKQGLHGKKGAARKAAPKKKTTKAKDDQPKKPTTPSFDFGDEDE
jgi:hypothetical protein